MAASSDAPSPVLVIGGTYFLGHSVVHALLAAGHPVYIMNRGSSSGSAALAELIGEGVVHLAGDRNQVQDLSSALVEASSGQLNRLIVVDMIMFRAAQLEIFLQALTAAAAADETLPSIKSYVFISSLSALAACENAEGSVGEPAEEMSEASAEVLRGCINPDARPYALNKHAVHLRLLELWEQHQFPFTTLYIPAMSGPASRDGGHWDTRHWAYQLVASSQQPWHLHEMLRDRRFRVTAHARHVAEMVLLVVGSSCAKGEAFHVAMAEAVTCEEYLKAIQLQLGIKSAPAVRYSTERSAWMGPLFGREAKRSWGVVSIEKARRMLNWHPEPLESWLRDTVAWWATAAESPTNVPIPLASLSEAVANELHKPVSTTSKMDVIVPNKCPEGATLKIKSSDGATLKIRVPQGARDGDKLQLVKDDSTDNWSVTLIKQ